MTPSETRPPGEPFDRERKRKQFRPRQIKCYLCHKWGHLAKDCRLQISGERKDHPELAKDRSNPVERKVCAMESSGIAATTVCKVEEQDFSVALDSCSAVNVVTEEAAKRLGYIRVKTPTPIRMVGGPG